MKGQYETALSHKQFFNKRLRAPRKCQTVLPLGQNLLEKLEKYNNKPYVFFIKVDLIFLKGQYGSTRIALIHIFQKMLEIDIKHKLWMEISKESLR